MLDLRGWWCLGTRFSANMGISGDIMIFRPFSDDFQVITVILGEIQVIFRWFQVIFNDFLWVYMDYIYPNLWQLDSEHVDSPSHFGLPYFQTNYISQETSNLFEAQAQAWWFLAAIEVMLLKLRKICRGYPGQPWSSPRERQSFWSWMFSNPKHDSPFVGVLIPQKWPSLVDALVWAWKP